MFLLNTKYPISNANNLSKNIKNEIVHSKFNIENISYSNLDLVVEGLPKSFCSADNILYLNGNDIGHFFISNYDFDILFLKRKECSTVFATSNKNILMMDVKCDYMTGCGRITAYDFNTKKILQTVELIAVRYHVFK